MTAPTPRIATYDLVHQWSTGTDADTSAYDHPAYQTPPGVVIDGIGRAQDRAFSPPGTPALDDTLPNDDGILSPGGILGSFVGRGPETTFTATWGTEINGDAADVLGDAPDYLGDGRMGALLFFGTIDTAPQQIDRSAGAGVEIRSLGRMSLFTDKAPVLALSEGIRTDQAIALLLDAIGWPSSARDLDTGDTTLLYFWATGQASASTLLQQILAAEGVPACAYEDGFGVFHFEGRQRRQNAPRSTTARWRLVDHGAVGGAGLAYHVVPARWESNPDQVVANVSTTVNVRTPTAVQKIWEYGGPLVLGALTTVDIEATSSDPFKSAVVPALGTDYAVTGTALASVTLLETSGQKARIRITSGAGPATVLGVTSNGIQLRAVSLPVTSTVPVASIVDVALSAARFRPKDYAIPLWPEILPNQALDLVNSFARRYQRPRDQITVQLVNYDIYCMQAILEMAISDRVTITHTHANISADFFIEQMRHDLSAGGGLHRLVLSCERVTGDIPAQYGVARYGFDDYSE
jgi:hypothetical protein